MTKYILSPEAQNSLHKISTYSIKNFGTKRTKTYLQDIRKKMQALAENPLLGRIRKDLKPGYYIDFIGSHTIYYRTQSNHIEIIDVLHQSMEPSRHMGTSINLNAYPGECNHAQQARYIPGEAALFWLDFRFAQATEPPSLQFLQLQTLP